MTSAIKIMLRRIGRPLGNTPATSSVGISGGCPHRSPHCDTGYPRLRRVYKMTPPKRRHIPYYHMTRTAPRVISLETIREKIPYEGRTRRSDRAGKTSTALPETSTAKSMRVNDKNDSVAAKVCSLQNESWKWTLWERILLSRRIVPCRTKLKLTSSVANSLRKQRKKFNTPRKWRSSQLSQKPTSKQAVKETTFSDKVSDN